MGVGDGLVCSCERGLPLATPGSDARTIAIAAQIISYKVRKRAEVERQVMGRWLLFPVLLCMCLSLCLRVFDEAQQCLVTSLAAVELWEL